MKLKKNIYESQPLLKILVLIRDGYKYTASIALIIQRDAANTAKCIKKLIGSGLIKKSNEKRQCNIKGLELTLLGHKAIQYGQTTFFLERRIQNLREEQQLLRKEWQTKEVKRINK